MIRYVWNGSAKYLWSDHELTKEGRIEIPFSNQPIFVNILERKVRKTDADESWKVKLYYSDGKILEGWVWSGHSPLSITNKIELFDGRFNQ